MLGLNFLVANQIDPAIEELSNAAEAAGDPLEIHLILGNLYREKGQVGRAIQEHQALLQRPTCASSSTPTCCSASASTTSAAASSTARSRRSPKCCGSIPTTSTRCRTSRSCTKSSTSGREAYATRQKLAARDCPTQSRPRHQRDPRVPRERDRPRGAEAHGLRRGGAPLRGGDRARPAERAGVSQSRRRPLPAGRRRGAIARRGSG